MLCSIWVMRVWSLSSCKLCLASFLAEMPSLFCLLASGRACASHAFLHAVLDWVLPTGEPLNVLIVTIDLPHRRGVPFLQLICCDFLPHRQYTSVLCPCHFAISKVQYTAAGLSCVDIASREWSCAAYNYLLTSYMYIHSTCAHID